MKNVFDELYQAMKEQRELRVGVYCFILMLIALAVFLGLTETYL